MTTEAMTMEAHDQVVSELEAHRTGECTGENRTDGPSAPLTSTADDPRHEGHGSRKGWLANQDTRSGVQVAIQMLLEWRRTRGTHGGVGLRPLDFRIVAMEATCRTAAVFQSRTQMAETVERSEGLSKCLCLSVMGCSAPC